MRPRAIVRQYLCLMLIYPTTRDSKSDLGEQMIYCQLIVPFPPGCHSRVWGKH